MMKYNEWKILQESVFNLGLSKKPTLGMIGGIQEGGFNFQKDSEDGNEEDEEFEDDSDLDSEEDFSSPNDPKNSFPPDDADDMNFDDGQFDLAGLGNDKNLDSDLDSAIGGGDDEMNLDGDGLNGDVGGEGDPCPDCNPDGHGEADPECQTCHGQGFIDDMHVGEIGGDEVDGDIDNMNFSSHMKNYQKKYMSANPMQFQPIQPQQMQQTMRQEPQQFQQSQQFPKNPQLQMQKKFMDKGDKGVDNYAKKYCGVCKENIGTYAETQDDFISNLASNAKSTMNKKWSSGFTEDLLMKELDPEYEPQAGQAGFAPTGRIGSIGGGYTQDDINQIPVLESKTSK